MYLAMAPRDVALVTQLLVELSPSVYEDQYKLFFCRYNDPPAVKKQKIAILELVAAEKTYTDIINELRSADLPSP